MKISTLFRLEENLNLDKRTLVTLRWIAIIGQFFALFVVFFILKLPFPIILASIIISIGLITNLLLQYKVKSTQIRDFHASIVLIYDLIQLSFLLYLTGGISNPFIILLIIPTIVSSTFLSMGTTIILGMFTVISIFLLTIFHYPLPGLHEHGVTFPVYYLFGVIISIIIGLVFLSYFGIRFSGEVKKRSDALAKLKEIVAKEYELELLGGQAAAAAHSLGTPLATITVIAKELKKEIGLDPKFSKDIDLLISQSKRCGEILKQIAQKKIVEDKFIGSLKLEDLLEEIIRSFRENTSKEIILNLDNDKNKFYTKRTAEIIFGLRNFIGNAVKFSKSKVEIIVVSDEQKLNIQIIDDGPGFPEDIIEFLGEPYIKSKSTETISNSGTGLGTFLGKTLLERQGAVLSFNNQKKKGAIVSISWLIKLLKFNS